MWTGRSAPCERPHRKLKLESTDVILFSSHAKKLASFFYQNFVFGQNKSRIFWRYKLVIQITYSTVLNKLQSYSRILALGPEGLLAISRERCVFHVDRVLTSTRVGPAYVDRGRGSKT